MATDTPHHRSTSQTSGPTAGSESLTALEQEVLDEYARLRDNMDNMSAILAELTNNPSPEILDALRGLERKTSLVFTLLKASVYSIVLNQQIRDQDEEEEEFGRSTGAGSEGMGLGSSRGSGL